MQCFIQEQFKDQANASGSSVYLAKERVICKDLDLAKPKKVIRSSER